MGNKVNPESVLYFFFLIFVIIITFASIFFDLFHWVYILIAVVFLWYRFMLLFIAEIRKSKNYSRFKGSISVIIPVFNEQPSLLARTIRSVMASKEFVNGELIIGDDGSAIPVKDVLNDLGLLNEKTKIIRSEKNVGKREIQALCLQHATGEVIITLDSDTVVTLSTLRYLVQPFSDQSVGACTGQVQLLNEKQNTLTKATATLYWNAFNVARRSLSGFGVVSVCSGALSAYRRSVLEKVIKDYTNQYFLGVRCTYGDDRALTNLVLKRGYKIIYAGRSICYTESPSSLRGFLKQQLRWRKSMIREALVALSFSWKKSPLLFVESLFSLVLPFLNIFIMLGLFFYLLFFPSFIIPVLLGLLFVAFIHNIFLFFEDFKRARPSFTYALLSDFILVWLWPIALLSQRTTSWSTR